MTGYSLKQWCSMTQHEDVVRIRHMLRNAREAVAITAGKDFGHLKEDRILELALIRLIEVIGEAAARVSLSGQKQHSSIPWAQVIGMRNRLIHGYDQVDLSVLWDTVQEDLPPLIAELEKILERS